MAMPSGRCMGWKKWNEIREEFNIKKKYKSF